MNQTEVKNFYHNSFQKFLNITNIKLYSRNTSQGAVFAKRVNHTIKDLPKRPVFEERDSNWIDLLAVITKHYSNRVHTSTKLTSIQAFLTKNESYNYNNLLERRKKIKPKFQVQDFVRTAD